MQNISEVRAEAGRRGGLMTLKRYGRKHFQELGRRGAHVMHSTYDLVAVDLNDFALVHKQTGKVKAYISGKPLNAD
jgi:general stress protein YciG